MKYWAQGEWFSQVAVALVGSGGNDPAQFGCHSPVDWFPYNHQQWVGNR